MTYNLTTQLYVSTTTTSKPANDKCNIEFYEGTAIIVINLVLILVGTCGNFLIIFAVLKTPRLRQRASNFLLLSLAIADLLVTMCAQPLHAISMCFKTYGHYCVPEIDFAYDVTGNFSFFCSIFHLSAVSIDRALSALKPHTHQEMMKKKGLKIMLVTCWVSAVVFVCVRVPLAEAMLLSIALIFLNYGIIIVTYIVILYQITRDKVKSDDSAANSRKSSRDTRMEKRVSGTILIVIFFFSICALPLVGFYLSVRSAVLRNIGSVVYMWIRTLALSNSSMNFIVYSYRISHFRVAYLRILRNILRKPRQILGLPNIPTSLQESKHTDTFEQRSRTDTVAETPKMRNITVSSVVSENTNGKIGERNIANTGDEAAAAYTIPGQLN